MDSSASSASSDNGISVALPVLVFYVGARIRDFLRLQMADMVGTKEYYAGRFFQDGGISLCLARNGRRDVS
jgi:hypothetical protein